MKPADNGQGDFAEEFERFIRSTGRWRDCDPASLVDRWIAFVGQCQLGYRGEAEDYFNDLTVRASLAKAINEPKLASREEMAGIVEAVEAADSSFRSLLRPNVFPKFPEEEWWYRGIVKRAGKRLVKDLKDYYGIVIDVSEDDV